MAVTESGSARWLEAPIFGGLDEAAQARLATVWQAVHAPRHATLLKQAERGPRVLLVAEGSVTVYRELADGRRVPVNTCGPGEFVGDLNALLGRGHTATVVANGPCLLLQAENAEFVDVVTHIPALAEAALRQMAERLDRQTQAAASLAGLSVLGRVVSRLGQMLAELGEVRTDGAVLLRLPETLAGLGRHIGAERNSVGRALKKLERAGLIARPRRGVLEIPNLARLLIEWPRLEEHPRMR